MTDEIQFDRAEFTGANPGTSCTACGAPIHQEYFMVNGAMRCGLCRERLLSHFSEDSQSRGGRRFLRAAAFGSGAALLGAGIYYAVLTLTGYEVGLIAILVGWMVGSAVRTGAEYRGGRAYQALAVGLTYLAIVGTYIPLIIKGLKEQPQETAQSAKATEVGAEPTAEGDPLVTATAAASPTGAAAEAAAPNETIPETPPGLLMLVMAALFLVGLALISPFLAGFENAIGLLIIGFALYEAWKLNLRPKIAITGPFTIKPPSTREPEVAVPEAPAAPVSPSEPSGPSSPSG